MSFDVDDHCDPSTWDAFVSSQASGNFMQSHAWGLLQRELGWEPRYCTLREGGETRAAVLLLTRRVPGLGTRVFHAPRGPVVDYRNEELTEALMGELGRYVQSERGAFCRCDPYWAEPRKPTSRFALARARAVPRDWSYWNAPRFVFWLDLEGGEEAVMGRMTSRCRNDVRRGYKNDVVFSPGTDDDDLEDFHRLMVLTGQHKGIAFHGAQYYKRLLETLGGSAHARLFLGRFEAQAVTAGMSIVYGDKAWLMYAASDPEHYRLRANRTLQWEMIKWAREEGCTRYDFRGTATNDPPSPDDPGYGVYQFKKSFGPEFTRLIGYYDLVSRPFLYRVLRGVEEHVLPAAYRVRTWVQR